jgi:Ankyrin repeat
VQPLVDLSIQHALCYAAREGLLDAIPLLWDRLSPVGRSKFCDAGYDDPGGDTYFEGESSPIHQAVKYGHVEMVQQLVRTFNFNINHEDT